MVWFIVGGVALVLAVIGFWPRKRGVADGKVTRSRAITEGRVGNYDNPGSGF